MKFPIVLKPKYHGILEFDFVLSEPEKPSLKQYKKEDLKDDGCLLAVFVGIALLIFSLFVPYVGIPAGLIAFYFFKKNKTSIDVENEKIKIDCEKINSQIQKENDAAIETYTMLKKDFDMFEEVRAARRQQILTLNCALLNYISKNKNYELHYEKEEKKGASEKYFEDFLLKEYGTYIILDISVSGDNGTCYEPDFAYIDEQNGVYIDIEIDEPYTLEDGIPIHCENDDKDRNNFFLKNNWYVVRFTERQIIEEPKKCINVINSLLSEIQRINFSFSAIRYTNKFFPNEDSSWSYDTAKSLSNEKFREKLLEKIDYEFTPRPIEISKNKEIAKNPNNTKTPDSYDTDDLPF